MELVQDSGWARTKACDAAYDLRVVQTQNLEEWEEDKERETPILNLAAALRDDARAAGAALGFSVVSDKSFMKPLWGDWNLLYAHKVCNIVGRNINGRTNWLSEQSLACISRAYIR